MFARSVDSVEYYVLLGDMRDHDIGVRMLRSATGDTRRNQDQRSAQAAKVSTKSNAIKSVWLRMQVNSVMF